MSSNAAAVSPRSVETSSGRIAYVEAGSGPVALFVHGVLLNKHLWRHQLSALSDIRRCLAVDLLAHGDTRYHLIKMSRLLPTRRCCVSRLYALKIDQVDLVGNDSGGGICPDLRCA